jgi:hypothetical protein
MHRVSSVAAVLLSFLGVVSAEERSFRPHADQPSTPIVPPESGTSGSDLGRSGGVIIPPAGVDPGMKRTPPASGARMPVIPPPGTPGGDPSITPK